jgi:hypothetical protein
MFQDKDVFTKLVSFLNRSRLNRIVAKHKDNKHVKHFSCWNQLLALLLGKLSNRKILRGFIVDVDAHHSKTHH